MAGTEDAPVLGDPRLRGPALPGLEQQLQVISWEFYQVPEGPGLGVWRPAEEYILEVQGLDDLRQGDLSRGKMAVTLLSWRLGRGRAVRATEGVGVEAATLATPARPGPALRKEITPGLERKEFC